jgi:hypothetical protein
MSLSLSLVALIALSILGIYNTLLLSPSSAIITVTVVPTCLIS